MAKLRRYVVGSVLKSKEAGQADYVKLRGDMKDRLLSAVSKMDAKKGLSFRLESQKAQIASLDQAIKEGKLSSENGEKARERINKIPDYVRFELVMFSDEE